MEHHPYYPPVGAANAHLYLHESINPAREYVYYEDATFADKTSHNACVGYDHKDHTDYSHNDSPTRVRSMCNRVGGAAKEREVRGGRVGCDGHEWREKREGRGVRSSRDLREYVVTVDENAPPRLPEKHFDCKQTAFCVACLALVSCIMLMAVVILTLTTLPLYAIAMTSRTGEVVHSKSYETARDSLTHRVTPVIFDGIELGIVGRERVQGAAATETNQTGREIG